MDKNISKKLDELLKSKKTLQESHFLVTKAVADTIRKGLAKHGTHDQSTHGRRAGRRQQYGEEIIAAPERVRQLREEARKPITTRERAARALDRTHSIGERGPRTYNARQRIAAALDAGKLPTKKDIEWLERISRKSKKVTKRNVIPTARLGRTTKDVQEPADYRTLPGRDKAEVSKQITARQARELHGRVRAGWGRPGLTPKARLERIPVRGGGVEVQAAKRGNVKPKGSKIRKEPELSGETTKVWPAVAATAARVGARLAARYGPKVAQTVSRAARAAWRAKTGTPGRPGVPSRPGSAVGAAARAAYRSAGRPGQRVVRPAVEYARGVEQVTRVPRQAQGSARWAGRGVAGAEAARRLRSAKPQKKLDKHLQGQHDQKDHTPKRQIAISREQAERRPVPTRQPTFDQLPVAVPELEPQEVSYEIGRGAVGAAGTAGGVVVGHAIRPALARFTRSIVRWTPIAAGAARAAAGARRLAGRGRRPRRGRGKLARAMQRSRASARRVIKKVGIRSLKFLSRVKVPGAIGVGLLAAGAAYGLLRRKPQKETAKLTKQNNVSLTPGDHVLALFDSLALIGIYIGNGKIRILTKTALADIKHDQENIVLVKPGTFVPTKDSNSEKLADLAETLTQELESVERIIEQVNTKPIKPMSKKVTKHLQGQHDQKDHTPKATLAAPKAPTTVAAPGVTRRIRPQRLGSLHRALNQVNAILDGVDAGTELYAKLKSTSASISEQINRLQGPEKVLKAIGEAQKSVDAVLSKGISHSLQTLASATKLIREQKPNEEISGESDRKLGDVIDELGGMISYLKDVKKKGQFEKQFGLRRRRMPRRKRTPFKPRRPGGTGGIRVIPPARPMPPRGHPGGGRFQERPKLRGPRPSRPRRLRPRYKMTKYENEQNYANHEEGSKEDND